jgi:transposase
VVDANSNPVHIIITEGARADCQKYINLISNFRDEYLLADKGYDSAEIINFAKNLGMIPVIPLNKNRVSKRLYDEYLYKLRHLVENAFLKLKGFREVATRYVKTTSYFRGAVVMSAIRLWLKVVA